ncbi:MAG: hypothetical protein ACLFRT_10120 [Actinomycetota bacterium]
MWIGKSSGQFTPAERRRPFIGLDAHLSRVLVDLDVCYTFLRLGDLLGELLAGGAGGQEQDA